MLSPVSLWHHRHASILTACRELFQLSNVPDKSQERYYMQQKKAEDLNEKVLKVFSIQKYFKFHVGLSCAYRIDFCFSA